MNSAPIIDRQAHREFERALREMNDALLVSSVHQHEMIDQAQKSKAAIVESTDDAIIGIDLNSIIISWNKGAETIFGYTAGEIVGTSVRRLISADRQYEENYILGVIKRGERVEHFETIRQAEDGRPIDITMSALPVKDAAGKVINLLMVAQDTTAARRAQVALRESKQVLQLTLAAAHIGHWDLNLVTQIATRSVQHDRIFGYEQPLGDWSHEWFLTHVHPDDRKDVDRLFQAGVAARTKWDIECRIIRRDGALRWIWAHVNIFTDAAGEAVRMLGMVSDITERKRVEAKIRQSEAHLVKAQRVAKLGSWELDVLNSRLHWSDQICEILGLHKSELPVTYEDFLERVHPIDRKRFDKAYRAALAGQAGLDIEHRIVLADGSEKIVHQMATLEKDELGLEVHLAGTLLDVTERKRKEADRESLYQQVLERREELRILSQQLIHAQEEERRRLAGELHDEIGQILTAVSLSLELTKRTVNEAGRECLDESRRVIGRAIEQVRNMSLNLRPPMLDDIGLESALRWLVDRQGNATGVKIDLVSSLGDKRVSPELETTCFRIVQETLTNVARHARAQTVRIDLALNDCELLLFVQDDGIGFDVSASRQRATTGGSFGLRGMEERTRLLGGEFKIESSTGTGTVMRVRLPLIA